MDQRRRPIPTDYHGEWYPSRTHAMWAYFFDAVGLTYDYDREPGRPDFRVPEMGLRAAVTGPAPSAAQLAWVERFVADSGEECVVLTGWPVHVVYGSYCHGNGLAGRVDACFSDEYTVRRKGGTPRLHYDPFEDQLAEDALVIAAMEYARKQWSRSVED